MMTMTKEYKKAIDDIAEDFKKSRELLDSIFQERLDVLKILLRGHSSGIEDVLGDSKVLDFGNESLRTALAWQEDMIKKILDLKRTWKKAVEVTHEC